MNGNCLDQAEAYHSESPPSHHGLIQNVLSVIDPALTDPEGKPCCRLAIY